APQRRLRRPAPGRRRSVPVARRGDRAPRDLGRARGDRGPPRSGAGPSGRGPRPRMVDRLREGIGARPPTYQGRSRLLAGAAAEVGLPPGEEEVSVAYSVETGDVRKVASDLLVLKYAQAFYGADEVVSSVLHARGISSLEGMQPEPGRSVIIDTQGA